MFVLALDTTTRAGSLALMRDNELIDAWSGDPGLTHAARLPAEILDGLARNRLTLRDIDLYAVAAGPGSFTGLRIGIATIQGLAFAHGKPVAGVSALDALARSTPNPVGEGWIAAWMDARRGEVFSCLYRTQHGVAPSDPRPVAAPEVDAPPLVLSRLAGQMAESPVTWVGDGAVAYRSILEAAAAGRPWRVLGAVPPLAPAIAALALLRAERGEAGPPHAVRPLYVRRPDAELARERRLSRKPDGPPGGAA